MAASVDLLVVPIHKEGDERLRRAHLSQPRRGAVTHMNEPPEPEVLLTIEELARAVGITPARLAHLVRLGIIDPIAFDPPRFKARAVVRLRRMLRLRQDLGVNLVGAAVILDLVDRLEWLQLESAPLRHRRPTSGMHVPGG